MSKNAIEQRLDEITSLWNEFAADDDARILIWKIDHDEGRMIELFLEMQNEAVGDTPDLFLQFHCPFVDTKNYGFELTTALEEQYEQSKKQIKESGLNTEWQFSVDRYLADTVTLIQASVSFHQYYEKIIERLVLVLLPESLNDASQWINWLRRLRDTPISHPIRIMLVDSTHQPLLTELQYETPDLVKIVKADLDMSHAATELAQAVVDKTPNEPGAIFRLHFMHLTTAVAEKNCEQAEKSAKYALNIAEKHKWLELQVTVYMALASAYMNNKDFKSALERYRLAGSVSQQAINEKNSVGESLLLQSRLAAGAAYVADAQFEPAAMLYYYTAPLAEKLQDKMMTLESWRMAAYCFAEIKQDEKAFYCGEKALDVVETMKKPERQNSTAAYVAQTLLGLAKKQGNSTQFEQIQERMLNLLGKNWDKDLKTSGNAS